jgi:hypothetical protein
MGGGGSKSAVVTKTKGETITTGKVFGRVESLLKIIIGSMIVVAIGAIIVKVTSQSGQTGPMICIAIFGLLLVYSIYTLNTINRVVTITTTTKPGWFGYPKKDEDDDKGEIYWAFEVALSGVIGSFMVVLIAFNKFNAASAPPPSQRAATVQRANIWKSRGRGGGKR